MTSGCLGDDRGVTILLTGPPGAGKTRTALLWSLQRRRPTFALDWDPIASAIEVSDDLRGHAALDVDSRYQLAAKVAAAHAATITASGVDCVIVGARAPRGTALPAGWEHTWDDLDQLDPYTVVLLPRMEVALERIGRMAPGVAPSRCPTITFGAVTRSAGSSGRGSPALLWLTPQT